MHICIDLIQHALPAIIMMTLWSFAYLATHTQFLYIYKWSSVMHDTQSAQISQKQDERNICVIMKTMCPPVYHHNGFVATHSL